MKHTIIIPSYNPTEKLVVLTKELIKNKITNIIVIDDGSTNNPKKIYKSLPKEVKIYYNEENKGKGYTLKEGISKLKDTDTFITVDNDGQHKTKDILKIIKALENNDVVFGKRNFNKKGVPPKSKYGNKFSSLAYKLLTGKTCDDTQTGLRGFNIKYKDYLLKVEGDRFDYEMNVLLKLTRKKIKIKYINIETIYEDNNKTTTFRAFKDSYLIYKKYIISLILIIIIIIALLLLFM